LTNDLAFDLIKYLLRHDTLQDSFKVSGLDLFNVILDSHSTKWLKRNSDDASRNQPYAKF